MSNDKTSSYPQGRLCRRCDRTEQACARNAGCCAACSHWGHLDADGNDKTPKPLRVLDVPTCPSERGYQRHRYLTQPACDGCRRAHARYVDARRLRVAV